MAESMNVYLLFHKSYLYVSYPAYIFFSWYFLFMKKSGFHFFKKVNKAIYLLVLENTREDQLAIGLMIHKIYTVGAQEKEGPLALLGTHLFSNLCFSLQELFQL